MSEYGMQVIALSALVLLVVYLIFSAIIVERLRVKVRRMEQKQDDPHVCICGKKDNLIATMNEDGDFYQDMEWIGD